MSDKLRWRLGETRSVVAPAAPNVAIEIGDLVAWNAESVFPANATQIAATFEDTQADFTSKFLGVAMNSSPLGAATQVRVATSGVFEFDCERATYRLGDLIGPAALDATGALANQKTLKVSSPQLAVGQVFRHTEAPGETVCVAVRSNFFN